MQKKIYKSIILIAWTVLITYNSWAIGEKNTHNTNKVNGKRPDIPGKLQFNFGFNFLTDSEKKLSVKTWNSKSLSFYYIYPFDFPRVHISLIPGIGWGYERLNFNNALLDYKTVQNNQVLYLDSLSGVNVEKAFLEIHYLDFPLEIRYTARLENKEKSFFIGAGIIVRYLLSNTTKLNYDGKSTEQTQNFGVNTFQYVANFRVGVGGFSAYYRMGLNEFFKPSIAPYASLATVHNIGISFHLF